MRERGASEAEVLETIAEGEPVPAKRGRLAYRRNFQYQREWAGRFYSIKQVMPVVKETRGNAVIVTVYTFYF
jgi:hypothetical protein